jgi:hypothetical protein
MKGEHRMLKFGTDPEVFASYKAPATDEFLSHSVFAYSPAALEKFEGIKPIGGDMKHPVFIDTPDHKIIMDGAAFELNLKRPYQNIKEFYGVIQGAIDHLDEWIQSKGYSLFKQPVVNFDYKRFWTEELWEDQRFMQGVIFGCDPDEDIFAVDWLPHIMNVENHPFRYGGGHIHVSGDELISTYPLIFVKMMALFVGNFCVANSPFPDSEKLRAYYYGKPGKYRKQAYSDGSSGIEYRTPSNSWLSYPIEKFEAMMENINLVVDTMNTNRKKTRDLIESFSSKTITAITQADPILAIETLKEVGGINV